MYITTLIPKLLHFFYHEWQRVSKSSNHLIVTGWASILILILILIIIIIIVILRCLWRRRGRLYEATKASLPSSNTTDTGVHLTQLITECVKASIHALQLRHDRLESHTTRGWRSANVEEVEEARGVAVSVYGRFDRSWASLHLTIATSMAHITEKCVDFG